MDDTGPPLSLTEAAAAVAPAVRAAQALPARRRAEALRTLVRDGVHTVAMQASVDLGGTGEQLAPLAAAVREHLPAGAEDGLNPRTTVFVRLLRRDACEAAWLLAHDNASGVVQASRTVSTWAGGSHLHTRLPLPTVVDPGPGAVHAWLPGFRDPRFDVPDTDYDITSRVVLRQILDQALLRDGALHLYGAAYLGELDAGPDDLVTVRWTGPRGADTVVVAAVRARRTDFVQVRGPDLTRLAWSGWSAHIDLARFATRPGVWRAELVVEQQGVRRQAPLGTRRGPLAAPELMGAAVTAHGLRFCIDDGLARAGLAVRAERPGHVATVVAQPARRALHRMQRVAVSAVAARRR